jgi:hypothetical protein
VEAHWKKGKTGWNSSLPTKLVKKLVWVPVISFCKISIPVMHLMPWYAETGRSRPLIAWLYPLTLMGITRKGTQAFTFSKALGCKLYEDKGTSEAGHSPTCAHFFG